MHKMIIAAFSATFQPKYSMICFSISIFSSKDIASSSVSSLDDTMQWTQKEIRCVKNSLKRESSKMKGWETKHGLILIQSEHTANE